MNFTFAHNNLNVYDLEKSLDFYQKALNLKVEREKLADDESFKLVYLTDGVTPHLLELTWLRDMDRPYELGDNEIHLAFAVDDFDAAYKKHKEMGCICFENPRKAVGYHERRKSDHAFFFPCSCGLWRKNSTPRCKLSGEKRRVRGADRVKWNGKIHSDQMCIRPASSE